MNIGDLIRTKRMEAGLGQQELADMLGVTKAAVCRWQAGNNGIKQKTVKKLADALHITQRQIINASVGYDDDDLSTQQRVFIKLIRSADPVYKNVAIQILRQHQLT